MPMRYHTINENVLPLHSQLSIAGARCLLSTNSAGVLACMSRWQDPGGSRGSSFELSVLLDPEVRRDNNETVQFRGLHHLVFGIFSRGDSFVFDLLRRRITGVVSIETASDDQFWNTLLVPVALGVLGAAIGVVPLHCACLDRDGDGLLIAGVSGAGKSTLTAALSQCGFAVVSDGWTYAAKNYDGGPTAHGISAPLKLLPDAVEYFPELQGSKLTKTFNAEIAFEVDPAQTFRAAVRRFSRPRWLMLLERVNEVGCDIVPLSGEAARSFFQQRMERLPFQLEEAQATRAELLRALTNSECWLIRYGGPPQLAAETISRFCERN